MPYMTAEPFTLKDVIGLRLRDRGEDFLILRDAAESPVRGVIEKEENTNRKYVLVPPEADVQYGDRLYRCLTKEEYFVLDADHPSASGRIFAHYVYYETKPEREVRQVTQSQGAPNFTIHNAHGSIIGTQPTATINDPVFNFGVLEKGIEERGGEDIAELKAMLAEVKAQLEAGNALPKGILEKYSALMERHSWIMSPIAQLTLTWFLGRM